MITHTHTHRLAHVQTQTHGYCVTAAAGSNTETRLTECLKIQDQTFSKQLDVSSEYQDSFNIIMKEITDENASRYMNKTLAVTFKGNQ